jgi:cytochrome c556
MSLTRWKAKAVCLLPFAFLASCDRPQGQIRYSAVQEDEERVAAMYSMRAIGVELVTMFEDKKLEPSRIRELTAQLKKQADALPQHFAYAPDPKRRPLPATKASIWTAPDDFQRAMTAFQSKSTNLAAAVNATSNAELESLWPVLVDTGDSCTACHNQFRVGGDPSHE